MGNTWDEPCDFPKLLPGENVLVAVQRGRKQAERRSLHEWRRWSCLSQEPKTAVVHWAVDLRIVSCIERQHLRSVKGPLQALSSVSVMHTSNLSGARGMDYLHGWIGTILKANMRPLAWVETSQFTEHQVEHAKGFLPQ